MRTALPAARISSTHRRRSPASIFTREKARELIPGWNKLAWVTFIGHSHLTTTYQYNGRKVKDVTGEYSYNPAYKYLFNVGSVGQPRDRNPEACFVMFDTDSKSVRHLRVAYDIERAAARIREVASQHQVPMIENKPLARMLFKHARVGQEVPANLFAAVAEIMAWVYRINRYRYFSERNKA